VKPTRNKAELYRWLWTFIRPYRKRLFVGFLGVLLYGPANVAVISVIKYVWVWVFERRDSAAVWQVVGAAVLLPVAVLLRMGTDGLQKYFLGWVGERTIADIRKAVFAKIQTFSLDFFGTRRTGELISRVGNDVGLIQYSVSTIVEDLIKQPISMVAVLCYLFWNNPWLTLVVVAFFPLCIVPAVVAGRRTRKASREAQHQAGALMTVLHEGIVGWRVIKVFCAEDREVADYGHHLNLYFRERMRMIRARLVSVPVVELIAAVGAMAVFLVAYFMKMPSQDLVPYAIGVFMLYDPIKKISRIHLHIEESLSGAERVLQILHQPPLIVEQPTARELPAISQSLQFEHVSFQYDADRVVVRDIHLNIPAGSVVALVGGSGGGKTTLLNLVPRFMDPTMGAIRIDGQDIREVTLRSLRQQMGLVTQETFLFNDTVAANIAYAKPDATPDEIRQAAIRAHAHEFIEHLPQKYDTPIGETGMKLSGGQRQRLAIARAILRNPPILLLDEATSALDTESERIVQAALDDLMWGGNGKRRHTMLVIAHRLSTVQHADNIVVLEKGRLAQQGTHNELLARDGLYRRLYDLQFAS
jgi:subfamily B ATP-binding cassette protein MsbA